ncbi:MAG TPA: cytochrome c [Vicinamibacterales bacterium]|nr:cytochrome c [Vicinamibacterales bacterium]
MRSSQLLAATIVLVASVTALAQGPVYRFGTTPSAEEIKARDTAVSPGGKELPPGRGTVKEGATVYAQKCLSCHGPNGTGTRLHRGLIPLGNAKPIKIEGSLVPYATTVWDFINRAMPSTRPGSLTPDEVYAATAFVLFLNGVIEENDVLDATTLPRVRMPNRDRFVAVELDWKPGQRRPLGHYP